MLTRASRTSLLGLGLSVALTLGALASSQNAPAPSGSRVDLPAAVLRVTTRLVLVDVVVTDKDGRPVTGLTRDDFVLLEEGQPQTISAFSHESPGVRADAQPEPPPLPAHVYTNRPEYRTPPGPLVILLLDSLNTPWHDLAYMRQQMLKYIRTQVKPDQRVAVMVLGNNLMVLQDFTTDSRLLLAALERFSGERPAGLNNEPTQIAPQALAEAPAGAVERITANLERFHTEQAGATTDERVRVTLASLRAIGRAVAGYPGRKNLIWVSGAFPFTLVPERSGNFEAFRSYASEVRRTAGELTDAQVAVYPVDARGLVGPWFSGIGGSHATMNQLAQDTGGKAYYNRNDIEVAVSLAAADGTSYYFLAYHPENNNWDGKFRRIEVRVNRKELRIRHRRGYYATEGAINEATQKREKAQLEEMKAILRDPLPATAITFLARVRPPTPGEKELLAEFLLDAETLRYVPTADGHQSMKADFLVAAVSPEGRVLASNGHTIEAEFDPPRFAAIQETGLPFKCPLALVPGRYERLRLVVRDHLSGLAGTVDVPLALTVPD